MSKEKLTPEELFDKHANPQFAFEKAIKKDVFCEIIRNHERDLDELKNCVKVELDIIKNLISGKRVVNLDELIAYYESILKKYNV